MRRWAGSDEEHLEVPIELAADGRHLSCFFLLMRLVARLFGLGRRETRTAAADVLERLSYRRQLSRNADPCNGSAS